MSISAIVAENVFWICVVIYLILRLPRNLRARREPIKTSRRDLLDAVVGRFAQLCAGVIPITYIITKFPAFATYPFFPPFVVLGTAVMLAALYCIFRAHHDLGRAFSASLEIRQDHPLATAGIYRYVRHPMYLGFLLWAFAQAMLLPNWIAGFAAFLGWIVLFGSRVAREEAMMVQQFGDEYRSYAAHTARLVPGIY